mgnify:FL=1
MATKSRQANFTLDAEEYSAWEHTTKDLISKKIFRNKVEAFETYIHFLHLSNYDDIKKFKASIMTK